MRIGLNSFFRYDSQTSVLYISILLKIRLFKQTFPFRDNKAKYIDYFSDLQSF